MEAIHIVILGLTHLLVFTVSGIFFHYGNKKEHRETLLENENLKKEIDGLNVKITHLTEIIIKKNNQ